MPDEPTQGDVFIYSLRADTKTLRVCVLNARTDELARAAAEDYLVGRGMEREDAAEKLDGAFRQISALHGDVFGFWTINRR
jgi:hypothetical protein